MHVPPSTIHVPPSKLHVPSSIKNVPPSKLHVPPSTIHVPPFKLHVPPSKLHVPRARLCILTRLRRAADAPLRTGQDRAPPAPLSARPGTAVPIAARVSRAGPDSDCIAGSHGAARRRAATGEERARDTARPVAAARTREAPAIL